jgi:pantoate--beta-alanine ligase
MHVFHTVADFRQWHAQSAGKPLVIVPTMGALHDGHLNLMREARELAGEKGSVAVSIFVNPLQFGPKEDFAKYPRELEADSAKCASVGVDAIFAPSAEEVYAPDRSVIVLETKLSKVLCGASRPGHFDGVCTVVLKLFNCVQPAVAAFGKKDYQQLMVIRRMVRQLAMPVEILGGETTRAADGLALSSRNGYLSAAERAEAPRLAQVLRRTAEALQAQGVAQAASLEAAAADVLRTHGWAPDYVAIRRREDLGAPQAGDALVVLAAARLGSTRLIDNLEF